MQLVLAEVDGAIAGGIGGEDREDDLLVLVARDRTNEQDVVLVLTPLGDIDACGFFLQLIAEAVCRGQLKPAGSITTAPTFRPAALPSPATCWIEVS